MLEELFRQLVNLSPNEIVAFEGRLSSQLDRSYTWGLWGAAYVAHGGASDDGFEYFRLWLISKGSDVFEAVLKDPDSLADRNLAVGPDGVFELEELAYVPGRAWAEKTGRSEGEMPRAWSGLRPGGPADEKFDESEASLAKRYPKLWKKYGRHPLG